MTHHQDPGDQPTEDVLPVAADATFAMVPTWVLDADISDKALRLYAVLRRYADTGSGYANPRRRTLAARLKVADEKVVDRALRELRDLGAVVVVPRYSVPEAGKERQRLANGYVVQSVRGGGRPAPTPGGRPAPRVGARGPQQELEPLELEPTTLSNSSPLGSGTADPFDAFWAAYPRKTGKDGARRAYAKAVKRADHDEIMAGLLRYAFPADVHYQPHPATWLNDGRWQDEQPTPPPTAQTQRRPSDNPWEIYSPTDEAYKREQWVMSHPNGQPYPGDPDTRIRDADGKLVWSDRP